MSWVMSIAVRQMFVAVALLASSGAAFASSDGASQPLARVSLLSAPHEHQPLARVSLLSAPREHLTLARVLRSSFPSLRPPRLVLTGARPTRSPTQPSLMLDPRLLRWEIDEGAWFAPSVSSGAFVGRLLFLF